MAEPAGGPFGHASRIAVIENYLSGQGEITARDAWKHTYRLLLWIDPTTGLVHSYESDKCQPGKHWHERAKRVSARVAEEFGVPHGQLREHIDILFRQCLAELQRREGKRAPAAALAAAEEGDDAAAADPSGLVAVVEQFLGSDQHELAVRISDAARRHLAVENKRKNIVGEGFEDVLGVLLQRVTGIESQRIMLRSRLSGLPGYREPTVRRKEKRPDVAIVDPGRRTEMLISTKWSVRADREDQFADEYQFYRDHQVQPQAPETVLVTNEFDRARLASAVESPRFRFDRVVHIQPALLATAYGQDLADLGPVIRQRKLLSLTDFLNELAARFSS